MVYSVAELADGRLNQAMEEVERGRCVAITRNGCFVALLSPLSNAVVMHRVLTTGALVEELRRRAAEADTDKGLTTDEVLRELEERAVRKARRRGGAT